METRNERGFTLVELLVVTVILCILATITVFTVRGLTAEADDPACVAARTVQQTVSAAEHPCPT